ncbi:MAG: GNAT family N-acetyltransferase [Fibrobacterota bacterium]
MDKKAEIIPYSKKHLELWESIVENSNNGTLYHTQKFLGYHPEGRFENFHHLISLNGKISCVIPGCITQSEAGKTFVSYAGTSFGGFVVPEDFGLSDTDAVVCTFLDYLKEHKFKRVEITLPPLFFGRRQNHHMDFILSREGFGFKKREITSVITLNYPDGDVLSTFDAACRRAIKKAVTAGVTVRNDDSDEAYRTYYHILEKNLGLRHNVKPVHTVEEMLDIKRRFPDRVFLFGAYFKGKMIAGIWLLKANRDASVAFYISHRMDYQEVRPTNLLYYETLRTVLGWNQKYYDLGLFTVNMAPNYGLGRFKESFAAQGIFRDYFRKDIA